MADQRLNSLDRFRKNPGQRILEVHSHCEVPAGCGGAVLRWQDPRATIPLILSVYTQGEVDCLIDGKAMTISRIDLTPGIHVLGFAFPAVPLDRCLLALALAFDDRPRRSGDAGVTLPSSFRFSSANDGTWKYCLDPPGEDWMQPGFQPSSWPLLNESASPALEEYSRGDYALRRCQALGAVCLGVPSADPAYAETRPIWVRTTFEVPSCQILPSPLS